MKFAISHGRSKPLPYDRINLLFIKFAREVVKVSHCGARSSTGDGPLLSLRDISPTRGNYPRRL